MLVVLHLLCVFGQEIYSGATWVVTGRISECPVLSLKHDAHSTHPRLSDR